MNHLKFSVIIPVYNGAKYLGEAIQSAIDQTYKNFEIIVVSDASPDNTAEVVGQFDDARIIYIDHQENQGANVARNTAIRASSGELLAFLDQDDLFHPEKLQAHVDLLTRQPDVGFTYNARFELNHSSDTIRGIWQPQDDMTLADIVLSHQLSPTDMVVNRDWVFQVGLWDYEHPVNGSEIIFLGHLILEGCKFASARRALNYRRYHGGRTFNNLLAKHDAEQVARDIIFSDPRCPGEVKALRTTSYKNNSLAFALWAFAQDETSLGQEFIRDALHLDPSILDGQPCELIKTLVGYSIADETRDHEDLLKSMFNQLPTEVAYLFDQYDWVVARTYLVKGARDIMWGRLDQGQSNLTRAAELGARVDELFLRNLANQLLNFEATFGVKAVDPVMQNLALSLKPVASRADIRGLKGHLAVNRAFRKYKSEEYAKVPNQIVRAVVHNPNYLANRGVMAVLLRSIGYTIRQSKPV